MHNVHTRNNENTVGIYLDLFSNSNCKVLNMQQCMYVSHARTFTAIEMHPIMKYNNSWNLTD